MWFLKWLRSGALWRAMSASGDVCRDERTKVRCETATVLPSTSLGTVDLNSEHVCFRFSFSCLALRACQYLLYLKSQSPDGLPLVRL